MHNSIMMKQYKMNYIRMIPMLYLHNYLNHWNSHKINYKNNKSNIKSCNLSMKNNNHKSFI